MYIQPRIGPNSKSADPCRLCTRSTRSVPQFSIETLWLHNPVQFGCRAQRFKGLKTGCYWFFESRGLGTWKTEQELEPPPPKKSVSLKMYVFILTQSNDQEKITLFAEFFARRPVAIPYWVALPWPTLSSCTSVRASMSKGGGGGLEPVLDSQV